MSLNSPNESAYISHTHMALFLCCRSGCCATAGLVFYFSWPTKSKRAERILCHGSDEMPANCTLHSSCLLAEVTSLWSGMYVYLSRSLFFCPPVWERDTHKHTHVKLKMWKNAENVNKVCKVNHGDEWHLSLTALLQDIWTCLTSAYVTSSGVAKHPSSSPFSSNSLVALSSRYPSSTGGVSGHLIHDLRYRHLRTTAS